MPIFIYNLYKRCPRDGTATRTLIVAKAGTDRKAVKIIGEQCGKGLPIELVKKTSENEFIYVDESGSPTTWGRFQDRLPKT